MSQLLRTQYFNLLCFKLLYLMLSLSYTGSVWEAAGVCGLSRALWRFQGPPTSLGEFSASEDTSTPKRL